MSHHNAHYQSYKNAPGGEEEMIELGSNEGINRLSGYSKDNIGNTRSLEATTTTGRTWGPHGDHNPFVGLTSRRSSPDADNLTLRFISGDQTTNKYILRWLSLSILIRIRILDRSALTKFWKDVHS